MLLDPLGLLSLVLILLTFSLLRCYFLLSSASPFLFTKVVELNAGFDPTKSFPWIPGAFTAEENWAALVNKEGYGMGVVNFETTNFIGGFSGKKGVGGPYDPQTGYIAPVKSVALPSQGTYEYTFYLVLGDIDTIRAYANQVRPH